MSNPAIAISCVENLFAKQLHFINAGDCELGHCHNYNHLTLLASGKLKVKINDNETIYSAPHMIFIYKDIQHELTALENNTVAYCIHALRDLKSDDILDPSMIPKGVNPQLLAKPIAIPK